VLFLGVQGVPLNRQQPGDGGIPGLLLQIEHRVL
jgi:hypothetical protein